MRGKFHPEIITNSPMWGVKQGRVWKTRHFPASKVNISETVEKRPKLLLLTNKKSHMRFQLTRYRWPWMTCRFEIWIISVFRGISQIWEPTAAKRIKYCQRWNRPLNVLFSGVHVYYVDDAGRSSATGRQTRVEWSKQAIFELNASISQKTVGDISKVTIND